MEHEMLCKDGALFFHVSFGKLFLSRWSGGYAFPFVVVKTSSVWCSNRLQIDDFIFILKKKDIMLL